MHVLVYALCCRPDTRDRRDAWVGLMFTLIEHCQRSGGLCLAELADIRTC
jgi:hypothetical protein